MKKFILHISLFFLPIIVGLGIVIIQPTNNKRAYHYLTEDCEGRGAWMYRRIFESNEPIDIAFLGSSHTINGINDTLINKTLRDSGNGKTTCNLGYCRLGRDLTYVLMKHLIQRKKTKTFIIEVQTDEAAHSHPVFPFLADMKDIVDPKTIYNRSYPNNLYSASVAKWVYIRQNWMKEEYPYKYALRDDFGFTTNTHAADTSMLNAKKYQRNQDKWKSHTWTRRYNTPLSRAWFKEIGKLAQENQCTIYFLYLPPYGSPEKLPIEKPTYDLYGDTWILPDTMLNNKKNWYDTDHMNLSGANKVSAFIVKKILEIQ